MSKFRLFNGQILSDPNGKELVQVETPAHKKDTYVYLTYTEDEVSITEHRTVEEAPVSLIMETINQLDASVEGLMIDTLPQIVKMVQGV